MPVPSLVGPFPPTWLSSSKGPARAFTPADYPLVAWYDPSDALSVTQSGGLVSVLADKSGNGRDLTAAGAARPVTGSRLIGPLNALDYDGTAQFLASAAIVQAQPVTVFMVVQADDVSGANRQALGTDTSPAMFIAGGPAWYIDSGTSLPFAAPAPTTSPHVLYGVFNGAGSSGGLDGVQKVTGNAGTDGWATKAIRLGANLVPANFWDGTIGEVVIVAGALGADDIAAFQSYLAAKWIRTVFPVTANATVTVTPTAVKQPQLVRTVTVAITPTATRLVKAVRQATSTITATATRRVNLVRQATVTTVASALEQKVVVRAFTATVNITASATRRVNVARTATVTVTATMARLVSMVRSATVSTVASALRRIGLVRSATVTVAPTSSSVFVPGIQADLAVADEAVTILDVTDQAAATLAADDERVATLEVRDEAV